MRIIGEGKGGEAERERKESRESEGGEVCARRREMEKREERSERE